MVKSVAKLYYASIAPFSWILHLNDYGYMYQLWMLAQLYATKNISNANDHEESRVALFFDFR